jgi:hypothetical protein
MKSWKHKKRKDAVGNPVSCSVNKIFKPRSIKKLKAQNPISCPPTKTFRPENHSKKCNVPTKTSQLKNDGEDGINPFITAQDIPPIPSIPTKTSQLTNDGDNGVDPFITLQDLPPPPAIPTNTSDLNNDGSNGIDPFITLQDLPPPPTVPTKTSDLTNDGEDGTSPYVTADQLPSNLNLFATNVISDVPSYFKLVTSIDDPDYNTIPVNISTGAISTTNQFIASLVTTAGVLIGNPGIVNLTTVGNIRRVSGTGVAEFYYEVYHRDLGGVETLIATSSATPPINVSVYTEFIALALLNNGTFLLTDRIVIKYYGNRISGGSNPTYEFQFGGTSPVRTLFPVPASNLPIFPTKTSDLINDGANGIDPFITINDIPYQISKHPNLASFPLTGNDAFVYLAEDTGLFYLWNGISGTYDQITNNAFPTGLERITEGANTGWRLIGRNPANYGDIGSGAVDFSNSNTASTVRGARGSNSVAYGVNTRAVGSSSDAGGNSTQANGSNSFSRGNNSIADGNTSSVLGTNTQARSFSETVIGHFSTAPVPNSATTYDERDFAFRVGVGLDNSTRRDGFRVSKNGAVQFFINALTNITNAVTGFFVGNLADGNRPYYHNGTKWHGLQYIREVKVVAGTTYTLLEEDANNILHFTSNTDVTITIPTGLTSTNRYEGKQLGDGQLIFGTDIGVTLRVGVSEVAKTAEKYSVFGLDVIGSEEYMLYGKLELS